MPKMREMLLNSEGFQYSTSINLKIGYYHIRLRKKARNLCTIILPCGKHQYKRLPRGVRNSPENFQEKMNKMSRGFEFIRAYIDNLLIITKVDWSNQLEKLELNLKNIKYNGLKCNIEKSFYGQTEMVYLGFWVTQTGIQPIKKIEAIVNMKPPKNTKEVRVFIGIFNYYRDMWYKRSHLIHPLTALTSHKVKF